MLNAIVCLFDTKEIPHNISKIKFIPKKVKHFSIKNNEVITNRLGITLTPEQNTTTIVHTHVNVHQRKVYSG